MATTATTMSWERARLKQLAVAIREADAAISAAAKARIAYIDSHSNLKIGLIRAGRGFRVTRKSDAVLQQLEALEDAAIRRHSALLQERALLRR